MELRMIGKLNATTVIVVLLAINTVAGEYQARNEDEIEVLAAVFSSEISANHWTSSDLICFSIGGMDPSKKLVAELRRRKLNVCSEAEWRRKLACRFSIS